MSKLARIITGAAALLLLAVFAAPLWRIHLTAPQYPEGLGMQIRVKTIEGAGPTDLQNINGLNHYIGMKAIEPGEIPVLTVMPWVVGALVAGGLLVAFVGRRGTLYAWVAAFAASGTLGLYEFWRWQYEYGHNLDPEAPIKIPGMAYQPPFIGSKDILNFTATSWPGPGGIAAFVAFALAAVAAVVAFREGRQRTTVTTVPDSAVVAAAAARVHAMAAAAATAR
jgi:hypothetical protein